MTGFLIALLSFFGIVNEAPECDQKRTSRACEEPAYISAPGSDASSDDVETKQGYAPEGKQVRSTGYSTDISNGF